jgi:hypothetical protein
MTVTAKRDYQSDVHLILDWVGWRPTAEVSAGDGGQEMSTKMKGSRQ